MSRCQPLSDCIVPDPGTNDRQAWAANQQQAAEDWLQLLRVRARELMPGSHLVATATTMRESGSLLYHLSLMHQTWQEVGKQGLITQQECESLVASQWLRTREEWLAPLQGELKDHFELLEFHESSVTDAHWKIFQESTGNDADKAHALAEGYSKFFFGITPGLVNAHLTQRAQAEKDRILEVMKAEYIGLVSAHPTELRLPFALIVLRRK